MLPDYIAGFIVASGFLNFVQNLMSPGAIVCMLY